MTTIVVVVALSVTIILVAALLPIVGLRRLAVAGLLVSLLFAPYPLFDSPNGPIHHGMTDAKYVPYTYSIAIAVCLVLFARERGVVQWVSSAVGSAAYLLLLLTFVWSGESRELAGVLHLLTGLLAFALGIGIGQWLLTDLRNASLWLYVVLGILAVQTAIMFAQLLGLPIGLYGTTAYFVAEGRPVGTFIHPSVPGKVALLLLPSLLVFTRLRSRQMRYLAWGSITLATLATALTQSRANLAAILCALLLWVVLDRRRTFRKRMILGSAFVLASVPVAAITLPRFLSDPEGGDRAQLLRTALDVLPRYFWQGLGANSYSAVVGQFDALAANGFPVHLTLLHLVVELGVIGAILIHAPLLAAGVVLVKRYRHAWPANDAALALLVVIPGLILIYVTGWGLLLQGVFALWLFAVGTSVGLALADAPRTIVTRAPGAPSHHTRSEVASDSSV